MPSSSPIHRSPLQLTGKAAKQQRDRAADKRRGSARARGYDQRWDQASKAFRQQHPLCLGCAEVGRTTPATLVDHIIPHRGDHALFWDTTNWQPLCDWHHNVVKQRLEEMHSTGTADTADLRADSEAARAMTLRLRP